MEEISGKFNILGLHAPDDIHTGQNSLWCCGEFDM